MRTRACTTHTHTHTHTRMRMRMRMHMHAHAHMHMGAHRQADTKDATGRVAAVASSRRPAGVGKRRATFGNKAKGRKRDPLFGKAGRGSKRKSR